MKSTFVFVVLLVLAAHEGKSQAPDLDFQLQTPVGPALVNPLDIANAGDGSGRLFIVEKRGTVRILENDTLRSAFFLDITAITGGIFTDGESGLLSLVFHPNFPTTPYIFVYYIKDSPLRSRISRFTVNPSNADDVLENSELMILEITQLVDQSNHKAGDMAFGPDGYLYIAVGDGGSFGDPGENGQDPEDLLGKILRIDINNTSGGNNYAVPATNPYFNDPDTLGEIWAMGMRNPWRLSFDSGTGDLWIGDVGQGIWEEINFEPAGSGGGKNYGWDCYEGNAPYELTGCQPIGNYDFPIFVYPHNCSQGPCPYGTGNSITGGFVYRGSDFPDLQGYYICADYGSENIWLIDHDGSNTTITMQSGAGLFNQLASFGEDENGELYAVTQADLLYRVTQDGVLPVYLTHFELLPRETSVDLRWRVENVHDVNLFTLERSTDGIYFRAIGTVSPQTDVSVYTFTDVAPEPTINYYRLVYSYVDGGAQISEIRSIDRRKYGNSTEVYGNMRGNLEVVMHGDVGPSEVAIYTSDGRLITSQDVDLQRAEISGTSDLMTGVYVVVIRNENQTWVHKWFKS